MDEAYVFKKLNFDDNGGEGSSGGAAGVVNNNMVFVEDGMWRCFHCRQIFDIKQSLEHNCFKVDNDEGEENIAERLEKWGLNEIKFEEALCGPPPPPSAAIVTMKTEITPPIDIESRKVPPRTFTSNREPLQLDKDYDKYQQLLHIEKQIASLEEKKQAITKHIYRIELRFTRPKKRGNPKKRREYFYIYDRIELEYREFLQLVMKNDPRATIKTRKQCPLPSHNHHYFYENASSCYKGAFLPLWDPSLSGFPKG